MKSNEHEMELVCKDIDITYLYGKKILITGASGLIGSYFIDLLMHHNETYDADITIFGVSRKIEHFQARHQKTSSALLKLLAHDVIQPLEIDESIDYIVHAASNATPETFKTNPIDTIRANVDGTINVLDLARKSKVSKILYLSSSEVYGEPYHSEMVFTEQEMGLVNSLEPRSCYTESKRMGENICVNYHMLYDMPVVIARIGFVYGPTFTTHDNRVFPQFLRSAIADGQIVMKSTGKLVRSYIYVGDVVSAILVLLERGLSGQAYNVANRDSTVSIGELAQTIARHTNATIDFDIPSTDAQKGYAPFSRGTLDATKLEELGWNPIFDLSTGIQKTLERLAGQQ